MNGEKARTWDALLNHRPGMFAPTMQTIHKNEERINHISEIGIESLA